MQKKWWIILSVTAILIVMVLAVGQYPRLNIISGYAAKNMCSCIFEAKRSEKSVQHIDNNFTPVNLAKYTIDTTKRTVKASIFGLLERQTAYYDDVGCQLVPKGTTPKPYLVELPAPHNCPTAKYYPYGLEDPKDTIFKEVNYNKLNETVSQSFEVNDALDYYNRAIVILYKDRIIAEKYAKGFDKHSKLTGWSMAKSVLIALYGILEHENRIKTSDNNLFSEWTDGEKKNISLDNLFKMNSGLEWSENYTRSSDATRMLFLEQNTGNYQINKSLKHPIGTYWQYSSGTTNLLSYHLRNQFLTYQDYLDFPVSKLYDRLGMKTMTIETDYTGNFVFSSFAWASARDWAKLGLLFLHKGHWNGDQIFSENWVDYVTSPANGSDNKYGAHLWLNKAKTYKDVPDDMYYFAGHDGQRVFILPSQNLVIVRMGIDRSNKFNDNEFIKNIISCL